MDNVQVFFYIERPAGGVQKAPGLVYCYNE